MTFKNHYHYLVALKKLVWLQNGDVYSEIQGCVIMIKRLRIDLNSLLLKGYSSEDAPFSVSILFSYFQHVNKVENKVRQTNWAQYLLYFYLLFSPIKSVDLFNFVIDFAVY